MNVESEEKYYDIISDGLDTNGGEHYLNRTTVVMDEGHPLIEEEPDVDEMYDLFIQETGEIDTPELKELFENTIDYEQGGELVIEGNSGEEDEEEY